MFVGHCCHDGRLSATDGFWFYRSLVIFSPAMPSQPLILCWANAGLMVAGVIDINPWSAEIFYVNHRVFFQFKIIINVSDSSFKYSTWIPCYGSKAIINILFLKCEDRLETSHYDRDVKRRSSCWKGWNICFFLTVSSSSRLSAVSDQSPKWTLRPERRCVSWQEEMKWNKMNRALGHLCAHIG